MIFDNCSGGGSLLPFSGSNFLLFNEKMGFRTIGACNESIFVKLTLGRGSLRGSAGPNFDEDSVLAVLSAAAPPCRYWSSFTGIS